jgi:hypothetical protein
MSDSLAQEYDDSGPCRRGGAALEGFGLRLTTLRRHIAHYQQLRFFVRDGESHEVSLTRS